MSRTVTSSTLEAYNRWSTRYPPIPHNPLMLAEQRAMLSHWPVLAGKRALDLACGTGRYTRQLVEDGAAEVIPLDLCDGMLRQVAAPNRVQADMMRLPLRSGCLDVVVS